MGFLDNMKQLMEMKQKMDAVKKELDATRLTIGNEHVQVTVNGNRKITDITILKTDDVPALEGQLQKAINEALEQADAVMQKEMLAVTQGMMPPGM